MGHNLHAFILRGPFSEARAREFDMRFVALPADLTMFFVIDRYIDAWADKLGIQGDFPRLLYNFRVIHHMLCNIASEPLFAVIETEYVGGSGGQRAAAYRGSEEILAPGASINQVLRAIGVSRSAGLDEFDTVGLGNYRDTLDHFGKGYGE